MLIRDRRGIQQLTRAILDGRAWVRGRGGQELAIRFVDIDGSLKAGANGAALILDDGILRKTWPHPKDAPTLAAREGLTPPLEFRDAFKRLREGKASFVEGVETILALHAEEGWSAATEAGISPEAIRPMVLELREALDSLAAVLPLAARVRRGALPAIAVPFDQNETYAGG